MTAHAATRVTEAVRLLMPKLRTTALTALAMILAIVAALGVAVVKAPAYMAADQDPLALVFAAVLLGSVPIGFIYRQMLRKQQAMVLPVVAPTLGMTYAKDGSAILSGMPDQLLPRGRTSAEDHVQARVADRPVEMADVTIRSRTDRDMTLFRGLVLRIPNKGATPPFLIAPVMLARPGIAFGNFLSTDGYRHLRDINIGGSTFGLWVANLSGGESPALTAQVAVLVDGLARFEADALPHGIASDGKETWIALAHHRDLFRLGSLLPSEARILEAVQNAANDFSVPLRLARAMMDAEEAAARR